MKTSIVAAGEAFLLDCFLDDDFEDDLGFFEAPAGVAYNSTIAFIQKEDSNNSMLISAFGRCAALLRLKMFQLPFRI